MKRFDWLSFFIFKIEKNGVVMVARRSYDPSWCIGPAQHHYHRGRRSGVRQMNLTVSYYRCFRHYYTLSHANVTLN